MEEKNRGNNAAETPPKENDFSVPNKRDYEEELLAIIQSDLPSEEIREKLTDYHDNDIASVFGELTQANRRKLYHILSDDEISDIFSYLDNVEDYIAELDAEKAAARQKEFEATLPRTTRWTYSTSWRTTPETRSSTSWTTRPWRISK